MEELLTGMLLSKIMIFNMQHLLGFKHILYNIILIKRIHDTSININKYLTSRSNILKVCVLIQKNTLNINKHQAFNIKIKDFTTFLNTEK